MTYTKLLISSLAAAAMVLGGCHRLRLELVDASVQQPSNVALYFSMDNRKGEPVSGVGAKEFQIFEDGKLISLYESKQTILNPEVATVRYTLLLLDMSGSVVDSGQVPLIQEAVGQFIAALGEDEHVAIYAFDGREEILPIAAFGTSDKTASWRAQNLESWNAEDPSTNLNGAVIKAVEVLDEAKASSEVPLRFGTLVIFTDGTDRAHRATAKAALRAMQGSDIDSYVIGLGGEVDQEEMQRLSTSGVLHFAEKEKVVEAFKEMGEKLKARGTRYYLLSYCSPSRAGRHRLTVETQVGDDTGKLSFEFSAEGFEPGCDPYATPNFKPLEDAKQQEADRQWKEDRGREGKDGKRQVEDDESPFASKKSGAETASDEESKAERPAKSRPPTAY
jgi:hypothetical protein